MLDELLQSELDALVSDGVSPNVSSVTSLSADVKKTFDRWYSDQMTSSHHSANTDNNDDKDDERQTWSSWPASRLSNGHAVRAVAGQSGGRTWFDPVSEIPLLQRWLSDNSHPSRADMLRYTRELNDAPHRQALQRPLDVNNVVYWFKNARARAVSRAARHRLSLPPLNSSHVDDSSATGTVSRRPDNGRVPELPNCNAVYVVSPLLSRHDVTDGAASRKRRRRSVESDENHNERCTSSLSSSSSSSCSDMVTHVRLDDVDDDNREATDLSLRVRTRSASSLSDVQSDDVQHSSLSDDHVQRAGHQVANTSLHPALQTASTGAPLSLSLHVQQALQQQMQLAMRYMQHPLYTAGTPPTQRWLPWLNPEHDDDSSTAGSTAGAGGTETRCEVRRKRSRVFIDPLSEIPRLEQWFAIDSHPSSTAIERLTDELNRSAYRQRFPPLEAKNVSLWFKNHRAKVKRQTLALTSHQLMSDVKDDVKLPSSVTSNHYTSTASDVMVMVARDEAVS